MSKSKIQELLRKAQKHFDYLLDYEIRNNCIQVIGSRGGDICVYRLYENGMMTEV